MSEVKNDDLNFNDVKHRLDEIKDEVSSEEISLDDSLKLYEEAVNLGMKATKTVEQNIGDFLNDTSDADEAKESEVKNDDNSEA